MANPTPPALPAGLTIRKGTAADAAELARLRWDHCAEEGETGGHDLAAFTAEFDAFLPAALRSGRWTVWVAEIDGSLVAHVYIQRITKVPRPGRPERSAEPSARWGYVSAVYAAPHVRNRGVGSALLRRVIEWAREEPLQLLLLWPSERSVPFYARAGFVPSPEAVELDLEG
jgi:GNAT superfamily N-acetyltransferase